MRKLIARLREPAIAFDDQLRIAAVNLATERLLNYPASELIGQPNSKLRPVDPALRRQRDRTLRQHGVVDGLARMLDAAGELVVVHLRSKAIGLMDSDGIEYLAVMQPIPPQTATSPATVLVPATPISAYEARGAAANYPVVTTQTDRLTGYDDEQLDDYLHGLIRRNIRLARHIAKPRRAQHWLADQLGVDRRVANRWENDRPPKLVTLAKIAVLLDQPLEFFFTEHPIKDDDEATG